MNGSAGRAQASFLKGWTVVRYSAIGRVRLLSFLILHLVL